MTFLQIHKIIAALGTIATGLLSLLRPRSIKDFTGLEASSPRAVTEIRSVLGGLFVGVGLAPFLLPHPAVFQTLGVMYLAIGLVRAVSMVVDKSTERSNVISLVVEIVFGVILVV